METVLSLSLLFNLSVVELNSNSPTASASAQVGMDTEIRPMGVNHSTENEDDEHGIRG